MIFRRIQTIIAVAVALILTTATPASAGCRPAGLTWGTFHYATGSNFHCGMTVFHDNWGTTGFSQPEYTNLQVGGLTSCSSVSARVVTHYGGSLFDGARVYDYTVGDGAATTSYIGAGFALFGSSYWMTLTGVFDTFYQDTAFGC